MYHPLVDAGVNLGNHQFAQDIDNVVIKAQQNGIDNMLVIGCDVDSSKYALTLAKQYGFYASAGIHPHDAKNAEANFIDGILSLCRDDKVVAIGECGLDFNRNFSSKMQQTSIFQAQLKLAESLSMPVYLHERDAFSAMAQQLNGVKVKGVLHCFTGTHSQLEYYLEYGLMIGITGWVCDERRGEELRKCVPYIPDNRLLLETDAPYLLPRNIIPKPKSRRNEPSMLTHIVREVAQIRGQSVEHVAKLSRDNFHSLFSSKKAEK